jgi:hypothetical protein
MAETVTGLKKGLDSCTSRVGFLSVEELELDLDPLFERLDV